MKLKAPELVIVSMRGRKSLVYYLQAHESCVKMNFKVVYKCWNFPEFYLNVLNETKPAK